MGWKGSGPNFHSKKGMSELSKKQEEMETSLAENPFGGIATSMADSLQQAIQLDVGVPILIIGILLTFASAYLQYKTTRTGKTAINT